MRTFSSDFVNDGVAKVFSGDRYLERNADVRAAKVDPLVHYLLYGLDEGRATSFGDEQD